MGGKKCTARVLIGVLELITVEGCQLNYADCKINELSVCATNRKLRFMSCEFEEGFAEGRGGRIKFE